MSKQVDWSTFTSGFNVPVEMQPVLYTLMGKTLARGEKVDIKVIMDGEVFDAKLSNSGFNEQKFAAHKTDIVRVMYGTNAPLAKKFRELFADLYTRLAEIKATLQPKKQVRIPEGMNVSFTLAATATAGCFEIERVEQVENINAIVSEETFESQDVSWIDKSAGIVERERIVKIRKIDRSICDNLKRLYDFRCQISGERIGERFDSLVVEAHHIDDFVRSQNNDSSNIIILSPTFHRIIHRNRPQFNRRKLQFEFPNGVVEPVRLNLHLK